MKSANGVLILILGILSILMFGCLSGIPAWIMGNNSLKDIDQGLADPNERGLVTAGRILGMIGTALSLLGVCVWLVAMLGVFGLALTGGGR
ncbi:MAG TPA: hypothetical protein PLH94_01920 [Fimbriimonadaceae bacterium]|nr:hypothetical protein [Fimbriimonadaceae bacterium]